MLQPIRVISSQFFSNETQRHSGAHAILVLPLSEVSGRR
jgi:hypothetical protein